LIYADKYADIRMLEIDGINFVGFAAIAVGG
jgi:hypothetical protein